MDFIKKIIDSLYANIAAEWVVMATCIIFYYYSIDTLVKLKKTEQKSICFKKSFLLMLSMVFLTYYIFWHYFVIVPTSVFIGKFLFR